MVKRRTHERADLDMVRRKKREGIPDDETLRPRQVVSLKAVKALLPPVVWHLQGACNFAFRATPGMQRRGTEAHLWKAITACLFFLLGHLPEHVLRE